VEKTIDDNVISGQLEIEPGELEYSKAVMYFHDFLRIFFVTIYFYLIPFISIILSASEILFY